MKTNDKRQYVRCPWCGKQPVQVKRGRIVSHVTPGNSRCVGVGQPVPNTYKELK
jgi:hypothetical protein